MTLAVRRRARLALVVVIVVIAATGCRVRTDVGVDVNENGSGTVTVRVGLDDDALRQAPNLEQQLRTDDLKAAGWTVSAPVKDTDGFTTVAVSKPFANPAEAEKIFAELSGPNGPFRNFTLERKRSFAKTTFAFHGTVDFTGGLAAFSDSEVANQLDGKPLGDDVKAIEQRLHDTLDNVFQFRFAVRLPGDVTSNAPGQAANGAVWQPKLSEPAVQLVATSTDTRWGTIIAVIVAAVAGVLAVVLLGTGLFVRHRRRRRTAEA